MTAARQHGYTREVNPSRPDRDAAPTDPSSDDRSDQPPALDGRRRRLLFRATHRGMQETDRLFGGYVAPRIATLTDAELDALEEIMEFQDADLADWLVGRRPVPLERRSPLLADMLSAAHGGRAPAWD